ncbi:hypothetical protein RYH73_09245 [Olivibacter sp. CPCC 100613]|uniref:hypothetical protein n=1 Tax=Olivibacter sp. CPCC 100613 TaxID=3079931 RepID=UPI002FFD527F
MKLSFVLVPFLLSVGSVFGQVSQDKGIITPMYAATANNALHINHEGLRSERMPNVKRAVSKIGYGGMWHSPDNAWFVSAGVGGQIYLGDHNKQQGFGARIAPSFGASFGRWLNYSFGVRAGITGFQAKGLTQNGSYSTGKVFDESKWLEKQSFHFMNIHADVLFDWTNDIYGEFTDRKYHLIPYAGLGLATGFNNPSRMSLRPNIGILQTFRISQNFDFSFDVRGSMVGDAFDGEVGGRGGEGILSTQFGVIYNFR